jgi:hypothetical protein
MEEDGQEEQRFSARIGNVRGLITALHWQAIKTTSRQVGAAARGLPRALAAQGISASLREPELRPRLPHLQC